jgi:DNA repair protein RecN (Recombination protein N)
MLRELRIKNFAIIEDLNLSFSKGLNILSGETGAGKSIIIGALTLLLGGRASADLVRSAEREAVVEALFDVEPESQINHQLEAWGVTTEDGLLAKRVVSRSGKGKAFINGSLATLQMLGQLGMGLISISGQHEHQTLLREDRQIDILDLFGNLASLREEVEGGHKKLLEVSRRLHDLRELEKGKTQRKELLCFQIKEVGDANLKPEEEGRLREEEKILSNAQKLAELTGTAYDAVYQSPDSAMERLRETLAALKGVVAVDDSTKPIFSALETALFQLEDTAHSLRDYMQKIEDDQGLLEEIEIRLDEINKLKKKYGGTLEEVIHYKEKAEKELAQIELNEEELLKREEEEWALREKVMQHAMELSKKRGRVASLLSKKMEGELESLGMKKAVFKVKLEKIREKADGEEPESSPPGGFRLTEKGVDMVEFLVCPNPGEEMKPLAKIASGGELSRVVLALKRIAAQERGAATLVFDEVDSGIGGATAEVVGRKLKNVARRQQTLCITHLPQIASFADFHQSIYKKMEGGRTTTLVKKLDSLKEREEEIARMLGGTNITTKTREHAREMLKVAKQREKGAP